MPQDLQTSLSITLPSHWTWAAQVKTWAVSPDLYPCELSEAGKRRCKEAVAAAAAAWGRDLPELEAEDRLAVACEKAPTVDPVIAQMREAFQVRGKEAANLLRRYISQSRDFCLEGKCRSNPVIPRCDVQYPGITYRNSSAHHPLSGRQRVTDAETDKETAVWSLAWLNVLGIADLS